VNKRLHALEDETSEESALDRTEIGNGCRRTRRRCGSRGAVQTVRIQGGTLMFDATRCDSMLFRDVAATWLYRSCTPAGGGFGLYECGCVQTRRWRRLDGCDWWKDRIRGWFVSFAMRVRCARSEYETKPGGI